MSFIFYLVLDLKVIGFIYILKIEFCNSCNFWMYYFIIGLFGILYVLEIDFLN